MLPLILTDRHTSNCLCKPTSPRTLLATPAGFFVYPDLRPTNDPGHQYLDRLLGEIPARWTIQGYEALCPGVNRRTLQRDLKDLMEKGLLEAEGATNRLKYKLGLAGMP